MLCAAPRTVVTSPQSWTFLEYNGYFKTVVPVWSQCISFANTDSSVLCSIHANYSCLRCWMRPTMNSPGAKFSFSAFEFFCIHLSWIWFFWQHCTLQCLVVKTFQAIIVWHSVHTTMCCNHTRLIAGYWARAALLCETEQKKALACHSIVLHPPHPITITLSARPPGWRDLSSHRVKLTSPWRWLRPLISDEDHCRELNTF